MVTKVEGPSASMPRGIPVDIRGGPTVDPTKNVLDLVAAESKYQDAMRGELEKRLIIASDSLIKQMKMMTDATVAFQNSQVAAETRRIDQLAQTRQEFQNTIRDMLAESVRTTSTLVSTQLVQIQATFDTRVSKLEAGAFTQAGKQSVSDPAIADAITRMTSSMNAMQAAQADTLSRISGTKAERMGQGQVVAWIIGAAMLMAAIATPTVAFLAMRTH